MGLSSRPVEAHNTGKVFPDMFTMNLTFLKTFFKIVHSSKFIYVLLHVHAPIWRLLGK